MPPFREETGAVYGRLSVLRRSDERRWGKVHWVCLCACGQEVTVQVQSLRRGDTQSCGEPSCALLLLANEGRDTLSLVGEEWRPVLGFTGLYEVSDQGRVRSVDRVDTFGRLRRGRLLRPATAPYRAVSLSRASTQTTRKVCVLVLEAFAGPRPPGMEALHWDDVKTNDLLENLRWGSRTENQRDRARNKRTLNN